MTKLLSFFLWLIAALGLLLLIAVANGISVEPSVSPRHSSLSTEHQLRVEQLLQQSTSARARQDGRNILNISPADLNLAVNHVIGQPLGAAIDIHLRSNLIEARTSWELPKNPFGRFFNTKFQFTEIQGILRLSGISIGDLFVPVDFDLRALVTRLPLWIDQPTLAELPKQVLAVHVHSTALTLVYADVMQQEKETPHETTINLNQDAIDYYYRQLAGILSRSPDRLSGLITAMFKLAQNRSASGNAVAENRAALVALGLYATGKSARILLGLPPLDVRLPNKKVRLHGRWDLSRHFLASAAISAAAGGVLSRTIGQLKELKDSRGGSGFSFIDLAADHAGALLGSKAVESEKMARRMQKRLAFGLTNQQLLPPVRDFPEGLSEADFKLAFLDTDSSRYKRLVGAIDRRIAALKLYRTN